MNACTIVAKNYLAHARVLARSLREQHPDSTLTVLVLDGLDGYADPADEPFRVVTPYEIGCEAFDEMSRRYTVLELSTAVKPWLLRTLLAEDDHVVYLDPDIEVTAPLDELRSLAVEHGIVLTPHNLTPIPRDNRIPSEESILVAGAYNLGFIALGQGEVADAFLDWWSERLETDCYADPATGRFVDQRWIDLVPSIWPSTHILRDPTYNLAYWNFHARRLEFDDEGRPLVEGRRVRFLHFSGYDPRHPERLSKYQDRIEFDERPDVGRVADAYGKRLLTEGFEETSSWPYGIAGPISSSAIKGVNVIGYLETESGVGEIGRQAVTALDAAGVPALPVKISAPAYRENHEFPHVPTSSALYDTDLVCVNADMLPSVSGELTRDDDKYTIGWWWWELDTFPERWRKSFDLVDEVWAGSHFVASALARASSIPVIRIPTPVTMRPDVEPDRPRFGLPDGFLFLFLFDFNSVLARKNPTGVVEAFKRAFPERRDDVTLLLKSVNGETHPEALSALKATIGEREDVLLIDEYLDAEDRDTLMASCDCYVSLHRSEGFGLTLAEAMLLGKPVIATGYSGTNDFVSHETGFVVRYDLVEVGAGAEPYPAEAQWADPDLDDAAAQMRRVLEHPEEARRRAERGRRHLAEHHSPEAAGRAMALRLATLKPGSLPKIDRGAGDVAQLAREQTLELMQAPRPAPPSRLKRLLKRTLGVTTRADRERQREINEALWWCVEAQNLAMQAALTSLDHRVRETEAASAASISALRRRTEATQALAEAQEQHRLALRLLQQRLGATGLEAPDRIDPAAFAGVDDRQ